MVTKTHRTAADHETGSASGQSQITSRARNQLAEVAEAASVLCSATESIQQINQQLTQRAALRHQQMADRLREATTPAELLAIGSTMFSAGMQEVAQYWQDVAAATMKMQNDMVEHASSSQKQTLASTETSNPALQAWQNMFTMPMSSFSGSASSAHH